MVITKSRQVLPVRLHVTKVSGLNEDSVFLGVLEVRTFSCTVHTPTKTAVT
jgi:hypothetical protein